MVGERGRGYYMRFLKVLQIIDPEGRVDVPLLLVIAWAGNIAVMDQGLSWSYVAMGIGLLVSMQVDRFVKQRDVKKLSDSQEQRIMKLEADLSEIRGVLSIATQRTMF